MSIKLRINNLLSVGVDTNIVTAAVMFIVIDLDVNGL